MKLYKIKGKKVTGILSIIPDKRVKFFDEIDQYNFTKEKSLKLMETLGLNERRIVDNDVCASDLSIDGLKYLFESGKLKKEEISALIVVTQTPDYFMPANSYIIHGKLGLDQDTICIDITQGCAGYIIGLMQAFMILSLEGMNKVVLVASDTLSRRTCRKDRNTYPLIGDASSVTILENSNIDNQIYFNIQTDGSHWDWLTIPAGGFRKPSNEETRKVKEQKDGNYRSEEDFYMNGAGVFTFTQRTVANSILEMFQKVGKNIDSMDYFLFHQPNKFMLQKLAQKLKIQEEKIPNNIVEIYGNSSSATIPLNFCHNVSDLVTSKTLKICMAGFGVGLAWGTIIMDVGPLKFCEIMEKNNNNTIL